MNEAPNKPNTPDINEQWHRDFWAGDLDQDIILDMINDPRVSSRLQQICHDEIGANPDDVPDNVWQVVRLINNPSALFLLGTTRYAYALSSAAFKGQMNAVRDDLTPEVLRNAVELAKRTKNIEVLQIKGEAASNESILTAGAEVVATWIGSMVQAQAAAVRMRFDPKGAVLTANGDLDTHASSSLLLAYCQGR